MEETETPIKSGYLNIKSQSGFPINKILKKKSSNLKYCLLFKSSRQGIERLEICDNENDVKNSRIIPLKNCVKITKELSGNLINIITETGQLVLCVENEVDLDSWTKSFQSVAFKDKTGTGTLNRNAVIEDNDLYCSSYNEGKFTVTLLPTDTSIKNNLESKIYTLHLTTTEIQLKNYDDDSLICKFPYRFIRKYGYRDGKFTFEAGRKCDTGEGTFQIEHSSPQDIFRCMSAKMKSMKKLINGESLNSLDCGENQLNAALSMEAGSRSPLPPLINSPNSPDIDLSITNSHASLRGFLSSTDSINLQFPLKNNTIMPNKPPRKTLHIVNSNEKIKEANESLGFLDTPPPPPERNKKMNERDYECIEGITDAWKTLGIGDVKHTENVTTPEEELKNFVWQRSKSQRERERKDLKISIVDINENSTSSSTVTTPVQHPNKFIILDDDDGEVGDDNEYDRLEFFASKNKVTSGYKTIVPIIPIQSKKKPCISDDYELIVPLSTPSTPSTSTLPLSSNSSSTNNSSNNTSNNNNNIPSTLNYIDTQPSRLADDRAAGYGILRKSSLPLPSPTTSNATLSFSNISTSTTSTAILLSDDELPNMNRLDYAVVSKPKRV